MRAKICDKCNKRSSKKRIIKRFCFMKHFPEYDYFGFDLCGNCENELSGIIDKFFGLKK